MTNDIVTRLRNLRLDNILDGYETEQELLLEAIAQIENLNEQVETWKKLGAIEPFMKAYAKSRWGND